jgi:outer membrane biosynthesis protein TonB
MNRATTWSIAVHVVVVFVLFVVPRDWISERPKPALTITLGGMTGPRTTGTTSIGGRTVEQVVPQPKRPEVIRPVPTTAPAPVPIKAPAQTARPSETSKPETTPARPVATGQQLSRGSTQVDTGAKGTGVGLAGGGGTGGETDLSKFCCPEYLTLAQRIDASWAGR